MRPWCARRCSAALRSRAPLQRSLSLAPCACSRRARRAAAQAFAEVLKQVQTLSFDVVVFDTAPTGHTLRLLQLPATLEKSLGKLMSLQSGLGSLFSSLTSMLGGGVDEESMFSKLQSLKTQVEGINAQFQDASLTTFVCVACAEFLSLYETERLVQELARNDIDVRARGGAVRRTRLTRQRLQVHNVIINQVLFPEAGSGSRLLAARIRMQQVRRRRRPQLATASCSLTRPGRRAQRFLSQYHDLYEDFNVLELPLLPEEVRGGDALRSFSEILMLDQEERLARAAAAMQECPQEEASAELVQLRADNEALRAALAARS